MLNISGAIKRQAARRRLATPLGDDAWLVRRGAARRSVAIDRLDDTTWVVRRRGRGGRVVQRVGSERLRTDLVVDRKQLRSNPQGHHLQLLRHLGAEHVGWLLQRLGVNVVLDVGANRGQYAQTLRRTGFTGRIVSFEPVPEQVERLRRASRDDPFWEIRACALGDLDETMPINVGVGEGRLSSLLPATEFGRTWNARIDAERTVDVPVRRLDDLFDELIDGVRDPRVYLKLDTQGYDLRAFAGAGDRVRDIVAMQSEVSIVALYEGMPHFTEQLATYERAGFELAGMYPVIIDRPTLRTIEFDAVLVRASAVR